MRILVTGAAGLLGSKVAKLSAQRGHEVFSAYNSHPPSTGRPMHLDLTNLDEAYDVIVKVQPETILHAAALTDVDFCEKKPDLAQAINGHATGRIAEAAARLGAYMIYVSTDYVFDGTIGRYSENDHPNPLNAYGCSKLLGERLTQEKASSYCIARTSVLFGWGRDFRKNFATWVIEELESNRPLKALTDHTASPTLDESLAEMLLELAVKQSQGIIHVSGATPFDRYSFALRIAEKFQLPTGLIEPTTSDRIKWKAKRPRDSSLRVDKATSLLDSKPLKLDDALERFRVGRRK